MDKEVPMSKCFLCPRECGADRRAGELGFCAQGEDLRVARIAPHMFEEPPISGTRGSGTVFFVGCSMGCVFCQNRDISRGSAEGKMLTPKELSDAFLSLQDMGVHNINLVTPTHFSKGIRRALELSRHKLTIPVVYNTSGYEKTEALRELEGLIDVYMPDMKYASEETAKKYSGAPDYPSVAIRAIKEMYRQVGAYSYGDGGLLKKGLLIRHLILPSNRKDSIAVLELLARELPTRSVLLSLMSQYTPDFAMDCPYPELHRRLTSFEYSSVLEHAAALGFDGFMQGRASASRGFTPDFN